MDVAISSIKYFERICFMSKFSAKKGVVPPSLRTSSLPTDRTLSTPEKARFNLESNDSYQDLISLLLGTSVLCPPVETHRDGPSLDELTQTARVTDKQSQKHPVVGVGFVQGSTLFRTKQPVKKQHRCSTLSNSNDVERLPALESRPQSGVPTALDTSCAASQVIPPKAGPARFSQ